jgi:hypothetical protein
MSIAGKWQARHASSDVSASPIGGIPVADRSCLGWQQADLRSADRSGRDRIVTREGNHVFNLGNKRPQKAGALALSFVVVLSTLLATGAGTAQAAAPAPMVTVAKSPLGSAQSAFTGRTASGKRVTGSFTPFMFSQKNGHLRARGLVRGVVHQAGPNRRFAVVRTVPVRGVNGTSITNARQAAAAAAVPVCRILRLVLGPIRLNLLGLRIRTNRIRVNIVAVPGPGNLLGNLLCGIAGLLDGPPTPAQLTMATRQLNRVLRLLNLL